MRQLRREEVRVSLNEPIAITVTLTFNLFETSSRFERLDSNKLKTFRRHIKDLYTSVAITINCPAHLESIWHIFLV